MTNCKTTIETSNLRNTGSLINDALQSSSTNRRLHAKLMMLTNKGGFRLVSCGGRGGGGSKGGGGSSGGGDNGGGAGQSPNPLQAFCNSSISLRLETHFFLK